MLDVVVFVISIFIAGIVAGFEVRALLAESLPAQLGAARDRERERDAMQITQLKSERDMWRDKWKQETATTLDVPPPRPEPSRPFKLV